MTLSTNLAYLKEEKFIKILILAIQDITWLIRDPQRLFLNGRLQTWGKLNWIRHLHTAFKTNTQFKKSKLTLICQNLDNCIQVPKSKQLVAFYPSCSKCEAIKIELNSAHGCQKQLKKVWVLTKVLEARMKI